VSTSTRKPLLALLRLLALLTALTLVAAACGSGGDDNGGTGGGDEDEGQPVFGGSVSMGMEAETNTWLPGKFAGSNAGSMIQLALFDPLVRRDADGDMRPFLAESIEPNDDLTVWTVKLREGVMFHDATPLNAEAMKYNFDTLLLAEDSNTRGTLSTFQVLSLDVVDELTFTYTLGEANAAFVDILDGTIGMPFSPTAHQANPEGAGDSPVGTGPFTFVSWQRDSQLVVKRNEAYWMEDEDGNKLPYLDQITFRPITDENTRFQSLLAGDIDAFHTLRQANVRDARNAEESGQIEVSEFIGNNGGGSIFNTAVAPVDDQRVRQGLAYALDQAALVEILGGTGITPPQSQYFSPDSPWFSEDVDEAWPQNDPARAQELLDEYVNDPDRSDGKSPGDPIAIEFNCPPDPSLIELAQAYQQMWGAVGVEVNLNQVEQAAHIQNAIQDNYMVNCWRMGAQDDPYTVLSVAFGDPATQNLNFTNYTNPIIDENLEILRTETDFDTRYAAVEEIMTHFNEAVPNLWTGGTATTVGYLPKINNVDGWKFPDGTQGEGVVSAVVTWGQVWVEA
jgi:peptide/nickel transport system substrate-binding protein